MKTKSLILLLTTVILSSCAKSYSLEFNLKEYPEELSFHTEAQDGYFKDSYEYIGTYAKSSNEDLGKSIPINITWEAKTNIKNPIYHFEYSVNEDLSNSKTIETNTESVDLNNLYLNTTYYYRVSSNSPDTKTTYVSDIGSFKTTGLGLRNLNIPSLSNIRDLGGQIIENGKRIKQGLIYRSAAFNTAYTTEITISDDDINYLVNELGIKTDIDLRNNEEESKGIENGGITSSILGESVTYMHFPMIYRSSNILERPSNLESIQNFFEALSDINNYPMVFHCSQGKDRTGGLAYVLELIFGESHEDAMKDYLFSNFSNVGSVHRTHIEGDAMIYGVIKKYENGETLQEKAYNYLVEKLEIPEETISKIKGILME